MTFHTCTMHKRTPPPLVFSYIHSYRCSNELVLGRSAGPETKDVPHKPALVAHSPLSSLEHPNTNLLQQCSSPCVLVRVSLALDKLRVSSNCDCMAVPIGRICQYIPCTGGAGYP